MRTALVVEDDLKSAELIRMQLEAEGFTVLHAVSAEVALALVMQQPVSLITLDIMLPHMDGWEFLNRVKQVPDLRSIPVLIISIVADSAKGFALGAAAVMQKPTSRQDLYEALVDLGLLPLSQGQTLKVLVVDDDPKRGRADRRPPDRAWPPPCCAPTADARRSSPRDGSDRT